MTDTLLKINLRQGLANTFHTFQVPEKSDYAQDGQGQPDAVELSLTTASRAAIWATANDASTARHVLGRRHSTARAVTGPPMTPPPVTDAPLTAESRFSEWFKKPCIGHRSPTSLPLWPDLRRATPTRWRCPGLSTCFATTPALCHWAFRCDPLTEPSGVTRPSGRTDVPSANR